MLAAIDSHEKFVSGAEMFSPVIVWQTFGHQSSQSAEMFFQDHINCADSTAAVLGEDKVRQYSAFIFGLKLFALLKWNWNKQQIPTVIDSNVPQLC